MNPNNCIITIKRLTGTESDKAYTSVYTDIRAMLIGADGKTQALYEMPLGTGYSFVILNQVEKIDPADQFIVTDPMSSGLAINDILVVQGAAQRTPALGSMVTEGICLKI